MSTQTGNKALVIGAHGGIGHATAQALLRHGWQVHALVRSTRGDADRAIHWHAGDAMKADDVRRAAEGAALVVHAVNPPGYRDWDRLVVPMMENAIAASRAAGARLVLPGTIYNYGPDAFPLLREDSPQHPATRKGELRVQMERRLEQAAQQGMRVLILRCGDFFGPRAGNNWLAQGMLTPGKPVRTLRYPAEPTHRHAWAYLPDVAETLARLLEREPELAAFERFHFGGYFLDGRELAQAVRAASRRPDVRLARFPWWLTAPAAPFNETLREMRKMRYLWRSPIQLDDRKLRAFLGEAPYTPLERAMHDTLAGLGCLEAR